MSDSGEIRLTQTIVDGRRVHLLNLTVRARSRRQHYAGSDFIDLGSGTIDQPQRLAKPNLIFSQQTSDQVQQIALGGAYQVEWSGLGEIGMGVQKTQYRKSIFEPGNVPVRERANPALFYGFGTVYLTPTVSVYGSFTQGLEESGSAPDRATNRGDPVPAIRTQQVDAGVRWAINTRLKFIGGGFDLKKPYDNLDSQNRFVRVGNLRNRGLEFSLTGRLAKGLNIVAGAVFLNPVVTSSAASSIKLGHRPIGLARQTLALNADWQIPGATRLSLDAGLTRQGSIFSSTDNTVAIPSRILLDIGGRLKIRAGKRPLSLRVSVTNLGNARGFDLRGAGTYDIIQGRTVSAYLTADL